MHKEVLIRDKETGKITVKKNVPLTDQEQEAVNKRERRFLDEKLLKEWKQKLAILDSQGMTRSMEDLISVLPKSSKDSLSPEVLEKYEEKQKLRSEKPSS